MKILYLCCQSDLGYKEPCGYACAFERLGVHRVLLDEDLTVNGHMDGVGARLAGIVPRSEIDRMRQLIGGSLLYVRPVTA